MNDMASRKDEEFGKEVGLMHEVLLTARRVGAGREFWKALAENWVLFQHLTEIVGLVQEEDLGVRELGAWIMSLVEEKPEPEEACVLNLDALCPDFKFPLRSVRGPRIEKSDGNGHNVVIPNQSYLLAEVDLTPPHEAVQQLQAMFPGLDVSNWEQALRIGVGQAVAGCARTNVIPTEMEESRSLDSARDDNVVTLGTNRLVFFPWVKRDALARIATALADAGPRNDSVPHYGALLEQGIFPKLKQVYQEKHNLGFKNYRAGKMSEDKFLQMRSEVAEWLAERETEVEGDICFSGAILDLFHGHSVNSSRYEVENNYPNLVLGTSYITNQMLLTQSQLQTAWRQLHWDIAGDKYDHEGNVSFPSSLYCGVRDREFRFVYGRSDSAVSLYSACVLPRAV